MARPLKIVSETRKLVLESIFCYPFASDEKEVIEYCKTNSSFDPVEVEKIAFNIFNSIKK